MSQFREISISNHGTPLAIAKLDCLSRNASFLLTLRDSGARFLAADMPEANNLTVGIMALVAEQEREAIAKRTRDALQAAKARGVRLGNPNGAAALKRAGKRGATLRFNNRRLLEPIGNIPPAEAEAAYYAAQEVPADRRVAAKPPPEKPVRFNPDRRSGLRHQRYPVRWACGFWWPGWELAR